MYSANWISGTGRRPYAPMPTATPMMPQSVSGVSNTRVLPNLACRPAVARNTPPMKPTSSPITMTSGSRSIITSSAELIAWIMFMRTVPSPVVSTGAWVSIVSVTRPAPCLRSRPSCRTCSGIHRAAPESAGACAARWTPEQVRGDEGSRGRWQTAASAFPRPWAARGLLLGDHHRLLLPEMPRHLLEHAVEQRVERLVQAVAEDAVLLGFLLRRLHFLGALEILRGVALLVPFADRDKVVLQALDRVAERPGGRLAGRAVLGGIVRRRMAFDAVGEVLDQRRALVGAGALGRPGGRRIDRQRVIAVDAQAGDAIADGARREGGRFRTGETGEARNRPLVVDDVEDHRGAVDAGEGAGGVEIALRGRALAAPGRGDARVALGGRGHRPAHGLRILRREVARDREEARLAHRIHDRQLLDLQPVALVRIDLVHHVDEAPAPRDEQPLLAIGGEAHILVIEREGGGDGDRLLAGALHVEAGLALALGAEHAFVERARQRHRTQHRAQRVGRQARVPRANRLAGLVEHAIQFLGLVDESGGPVGGGGTAHLAGGGQHHLGEIDRVAGAELRFRHMQRQRLQVGAHRVACHGLSTPSARSIP